MTAPTRSRRQSAGERKVLPFRPANGKRVRYRRRHPLRKLMVPFFGAVAIVGVPLWTASWLLTTPRLALQDLRVAVDRGVVASNDHPGGPPSPQRVPDAWVLQALAPLLGRNLLRLALSDAEMLLTDQPWIQAVRLTKELPHRLRVEIVVHRAAALLHDEDGLFYVDGGGRLIAPFSTTDGEVDLLLISRGEAMEQSGEAADLEAALAVAEEMRVAQATWSQGLSEVVVLGAQDFRLVTSELPFPLLVRAGTLEERVRKLEALVPQILARYGTVAAVDLRFARRIILEPFTRPTAGIRSSALMRG